MSEKKSETEGCATFEQLVEQLKDQGVKVVAKDGFSFADFERLAIPEAENVRPLWPLTPKVIFEMTAKMRGRPASYQEDFCMVLGGTPVTGEQALFLILRKISENQYFKVPSPAREGLSAFTGTPKCILFRCRNRILQHPNATLAMKISRDDSTIELLALQREHEAGQTSMCWRVGVIGGGAR